MHGFAGTIDATVEIDETIGPVRALAPRCVQSGQVNRIALEVEHGEVIKRLEADRPWTFNFSRYECRNASNATIAEKVHANKRLHKAVEAMHEQLGWANQEVAQQGAAHQRAVHQ